VLHQWELKFETAEMQFSECILPFPLKYLNSLFHLVVFEPKEVLNWLNDLEYNTNKHLSKGPTLQTKSDKIREEEERQTNEDTNIHCRSECQETSDNCCAFLQYKADKTRMQIQKLDNAVERNIYKFNYQNDSLHLVGEVQNGFWNGIMIGYEKWFLTMNMTIIAKFNHGKLQGKVWRMLEENGYLVANNLEMTGPDVLYIYPGFQMGLFGQFENGKMVDATPVFIEGFQCEDGMMKPTWKFMPHQNHFSYDPAAGTNSSDSNFLSSNPLLKDPLEDYWVEFQESTIKGAGDGVFLKRDAPKNTIVAFFNGIHISLDDTLRNEKMKQSVHKMWNDWDSDAMVYIPKNYININAYNASSGHKINHNSDYNVDAGYIDHPRFGKIRSIVTTKNLKAGEEIFCEYSNTIDTTTFVRQVFRDFTQFMDISQDEKRANFLETMENDYTAMLASMKHDPNKVYRKP